MGTVPVPVRMQDSTVLMGPAPRVVALQNSFIRIDSRVSYCVLCTKAIMQIVAEIIESNDSNFEASFFVFFDLE